jgi:hypothetical protein
MEAHSSYAALPLLHAALRTFDLVLHHHRLTTGESDTGLAAITKGFEAAGETVPDVLVDAERNPSRDAAVRLGLPVLAKHLKPRDLALALAHVLVDLVEKPS